MFGRHNLFKDPAKIVAEEKLAEREEQLWHIILSIDTLDNLIEDSDWFATYSQRIIDHCDRRYQERVASEDLEGKYQEAEAKHNYQN